MESYTSAFRLQAPSLFGITKGARVILSTPPAMYNSPSSHITALAQSIIACKPEAHNLFTVLPATLTGKPANNAAIRATLRLSSPAWFASPAITSSIACTSMFEFRFNNDFITFASKSSGRTELNFPPYLPTGVLTASIIKTSFINFFSF